MTPLRLSLRTLAQVAACASVALTLAACSTPRSNFYTLGPGASAGGAATSTNAAQAPKPRLLIEVSPVGVPSQIARNQLVVQAGDARVDVLEQERWASAPADEIRRALSGDLAARLGTFDVYDTPYAADANVYRISVNVRRFELWPGSRAVLDAVWSVRSTRTQAIATCSTKVDEPVSAAQANIGFEALVDAQRHALAQMADNIAATVTALDASGRATCTQ
jgi:uncharacterized lipoprotein YmbA